MQTLSKNNIPFIFLIVISAFWTFYYKSSNVINDFGSEKSEWFLFIDGLVILPLLCFFFVTNKKEAILKALAYGCLVILLGSFVIPESSKLVWHYLESSRYLVIAAFVSLEIITIFTVFFAIKASLTTEKDPDVSISEPIENIIGNGIISAILSFEARVWTYALFSKKINPQYFVGDQHFSCHKKDGTQSNQLGFILIILFEMPLMHMLIHFLWSPYAANVITGLTLLGLTFFVAEYKAISIRPISIMPKDILIRYGVWNPLKIPLSQIDSIKLNTTFIPRSSNVKRFNLAGNPNIEIKLNSGKFLYLGLDSPNEFVLAIEKYRGKSL